MRRRSSAGAATRGCDRRSRPRGYGAARLTGACAPAPGRLRGCSLGLVDACAGASVERARERRRRGKSDAGPRLRTIHVKRQQLLKERCRAAARHFAVPIGRVTTARGFAIRPLSGASSHRWGSRLPMRLLSRAIADPRAELTRDGFAACAGVHRLELRPNVAIGARAQEASLGRGPQPPVGYADARWVWWTRVPGLPLSERARAKAHG